MSENTANPTQEHDADESATGKKKTTINVDEDFNEEAHIVRDQDSKYKFFVAEAEGPSLERRPPPMDYEDMFDLTGECCLET